MDNAGKLVRKKKKDELNKLFIKAQKDPTAQFQLGVKYYAGKGIEQDYNKAFEYFKKSAEAGNVNAQYNLAVMYEDGLGTEKDINKAIKWYKKSAEYENEDAKEALKELGNEKSYEELVIFVDDEDKKQEEEQKEENSNELLKLGQKYYTGIGVKQDYKKAFEHFKKCAENGNAQAQCNLAKMYEKGYGVKEDFEESIKWYKKSAEKGNKYAKDSLNFYKFKCPNCKSSDLRKSSDDEYKKEEKKNKKNVILFSLIALIIAIVIAITLIKFFDVIGCTYCILILLAIFIIILICVVMLKDERENLYTCNSCKHVIVEEDYKQLFDCLKKSAENGNAQAQYNIGAMYQKADGIEDPDEKGKDLEEAIKWYKRAAIQGNKRAVEALRFNKKCPNCNSLNVKSDDGYLYTCNYCKQKFTDENYKLALQKYESASEKSDESKIIEYKEAHNYFLISAYDGNDKAQYFLGLLHLEGITIFKTKDFSVEKEDIIKKDINQAENWFEISAEYGNEKAKMALKQLEESELNEEKEEEIEKEIMKKLQKEANANGALNLTLEIISKIIGG